MLGHSRTLGLTQVNNGASKARLAKPINQRD